MSNTVLDTIHQNTIVEVRPYTDTDPKTMTVEKISTVAIDGQMVVWDLKVSALPRSLTMSKPVLCFLPQQSLESSLASMKIK